MERKSQKNTKAKSEVYLNISKLKERGWTETMIKKLLLNPDKEVSNPIFKSASTMKLYSIAKVETAELTESFIKYKSQAEKRSKTMKKVSDAKKYKLLEEINSMKYVVNIIPMESLMEKAIENYNDFHFYKAVQFENIDFLPVDKNADQKFINRIMVNYVRHNLTEYDTRLEEVAGRIGVHEGVIKIKCKILEEISKAYPELKKECSNQIERAINPPEYFI